MCMDLLKDVDLMDHRYYPGIPLDKEFAPEIGEGQVGKSIMCQLHIAFNL